LPGHYCPKASGAPVQCPPGTNTSSTGLQTVSDCQACPKGYYCPKNGTVSATRKCLPGYFCPGGVANPTDVSELVCPIAHMCPLGSGSPLPCPAGTYQDDVGEDSCALCPAGHYCLSGVSVPVECPKGHYCPNGTKYDINFPCVGGTYSPFEGLRECLDCPAGSKCAPGAVAYEPCGVGYYCPDRTSTPIRCPNGTFGQTNNLTTALQCTPCPPGQFCLGGFVAGECAPGYFCRGGQSTPMPEVDVHLPPEVPKEILQILEKLDGGQCPPGHFCPKATSSPHTCPNSTVRLDTHGETEEDCGPCPAGSICFPGDPVPQPCETGYYCPLGSSAVECPRGHYNPRFSSSRREDCQPCPSGYFCDDVAISDYSDWKCPTGMYCVEGCTEPLPCPPGSYRDTVGARNVTDCHQCPGGNYCPRGASVYFACGKVFRIM
jgi:hypothetical protein